MPATSLVAAAALVRQTLRIVVDEPGVLVEAARHQDIVGERHSGVGSTFVGVQLDEAAPQNGQGPCVVAPLPRRSTKGGRQLL